MDTNYLTIFKYLLLPSQEAGDVAYVLMEE